MYLILVIVTIFLALVISELLWRKKITSPETSRKLVHIVSGVVVAFLPFYTSYRAIAILSLLFGFVLFLSSKFKIFKSIKQVKRRSVGEYMFALVILILALISPEPYIFMIAMLNLALGDGLAALIGEKFGKSNRYKILNNQKSIIGSSTFLLASLLILFMAINLNYLDFKFPLLFLPLILLTAENFFSKGVDNLVIPIIVVVFLTNI